MNPINSDGKYFRPDRIAFDEERKEITIIDYKTGKPNKKHHQQMQKYANDLSELGWQITEKFLIYLDEEKIVAC